MITKFVYAAVAAAALMSPVPALASDIDAPGYYGDDAYDGYSPEDYAPPVVVRKKVIVERPVVVHRRPIVVERPVVVERPIVVEHNGVGRR